MDTDQPALEGGFLEASVRVSRGDSVQISRKVRFWHHNLCSSVYYPSESSQPAQMSQALVHLPSAICHLPFSVAAVPRSTATHGSPGSLRKPLMHVGIGYVLLAIGYSWLAPCLAASNYA